MTLPLFNVAPGALENLAGGDRVVLDGAEGRHAATVRRIRVGERVMVADGSGNRATTRVESVEQATLRLAIEEIEHEPEPAPRFVLVQALAKGDRDEDAIEAATEIGVDEIVPWQAGRSIVVWKGPRGEKAARKWANIVEAACKQSRRSRAPGLAPLVTTVGLAERIRGASAAYLLHEDAVTPLAGHGLPDQGDVLVIVGPEGGIAPDELAVFEAAGAVPVRLGATVLRSSSAGPAALAVLSAAGRWR